MGDLEDLVGVIWRRGTTAEERRIQAQDRISSWTRKRDEARANKRNTEAADCESKITYWSARLKALEERMARAQT